MEITKNIFADLFKKGIRIHIIFLTSLFLVMAVISLQSRYYKDISPRAIVIYLLLACCIYVGRWLTYRFLIKKRWLLLILLICITVALFSAIGIFSMMHFLHFKENGDISGFVVITPLLVILTMFAGGLIAMTRIVIRQQIKEIKILQHQAETELGLLTNKLSPHFLFNTLNNLYGLSIGDHQKVPGLLLKLSDLLGYALYSSDEPFVDLKDEVNYILNFIELEKIRMSDRLVLNVDIATYDPNSQIAPMILIVFVENAFKHAKNTLTEVSITMRLWVEPDYIHFMIENSCPDEPANVLDSKSSGLGMATTIKRLDLLYAAGYQLNYGKEKDTYRVNLKIPNLAKS